MRSLTKIPSLSVLFVVLAFVGAGCFGQQLPPPATPPIIPPVTEPMQIDSTSTSTATATTTQKATYVGFSRGAYDAALTEKGYSVMLYFYANWCPTCRVQEPQNIQAFKDLDLNVRAFRVNFNDNETDDTEKDLAKAFGVTYQHTFIFLDRNGKEITRKVGAIPPDELRNLLKEVANR